MIAGTLGGLAPDLDAIGFHLGIVHGFHRATPFHWPSTWIAVAMIGLVLIWLRRDAGTFVCVLALSALVHCGLDMTMAPLFWAAPFSWEPFELIHVPGGWSPYWLGFIFYWTFVPEILIWLAAIWVWKSRRSKTELLVRQAPS